MGWVPTSKAWDKGSKPGKVKVHPDPGENLSLRVCVCVSHEAVMMDYTPFCLHTLRTDTPMIADASVNTYETIYRFSKVLLVSQSSALRRSLSSPLSVYLLCVCLSLQPSICLSLQPSVCLALCICLSLSTLYLSSSLRLFPSPTLYLSSSLRCLSRQPSIRLALCVCLSLSNPRSVSLSNLLSV